jgi:phosphate butyryltransferase
MPLNSFKGLIEKVKEKEKKVLAIASAESREIITAAKQASDEGILKPFFLGDAEKITQICEEVKLGLGEIEVVDEPHPQKTSQLAVELVKKKKADMLMKGKVDTSTLLKAVLDKDRGLRSGKLLSHVSVIEVKDYPKFLLVTDGGMNISPTVTQKIDILNNSLEVAKKLGIVTPKVALLAAVETVNPAMPETVDAAVLVKMWERGDINDCVVDGPVAFDLAIDSTAALKKQVNSPVAGDTDIFLVPNISAGNIFVKGLIYLAGAKVGGIVVGCGVPIVLLSRSDTAEMKLYSMALGAALCE